MRPRKLLAFRWLGLLAIVMAAACETKPDQPTNPAVATININGNSATIGNFTNHTFTADRRGIVTATLRWTNGDLDFYASAASCTTNPFICDTRTFSEAGSGNSEVMTFGVLPNEVVRLWVFNFNATANQAYTIEVKIE